MPETDRPEAEPTANASTDAASAGQDTHGRVTEAASVSGGRAPRDSDGEGDDGDHDEGDDGDEGEEGGEGESAGAEGGEGGEAPKKKRRRRRRRKKKPAEGEAVAAGDGATGEGASARAEGSTSEGATAPAGPGAVAPAGPQARPSGEARGDRGPRRDGPGPHGPRRDGDRPQGDRGPRREGDRAQGDRPQGDRPQGDRPHADRPHGDRGPRRDGDRPFGDRGPRRDGDRPHGDRRGFGDRGPRRDDRGGGGGRPDSNRTLTASLFSHLLDSNRFNEVGDEEVKCKNPTCNNTWTWFKDQKVALQLRGLPLTPPARFCQSCFEADRQARFEERMGKDVEVPCAVRGCTHTWTWPRDAQQRHKTWLNRQKLRIEAEIAAAAAEGRTLSKRRTTLPEGPPPRLCALCDQKLRTLQPIELPCKVHGCAKTWTWTREAQLRDWVAMKTDDVSATPKTPRRMCMSCHDFVRKHQDREVKCGKPDCTRTWTYKVGAQLQDQLAGRTQTPIRLACGFSKQHVDCEFATRGPLQLTDASGALAGELPKGAEIMPCTEPGCTGTWIWTPGMTLAPLVDGQPAVDRMCDAHRLTHGAPARGGFVRVEATTAESEHSTEPDADHAHDEEPTAHDEAHVEYPAELLEGGGEADGEGTADGEGSSDGEGPADPEGAAVAEGEPSTEG